MYRFLLLICLLINCHAFAAAKTARSIQLSKTNAPKLSMQAVAKKTTGPGPQASVASSSFNVAKNILGAGILSLGSGVAFFSDSATGMYPATALCVIMGLMSTYAFKLIGEMCGKTQSDTLDAAWRKTVGARSAPVISASITSLCFAAALAYSIIIGDTAASLAATFELPAKLADRSNLLLLISTAVLLPLCSLKSLAALAPFSILGLGGILYTAVVMGIRLFEKSYLPGGKFHESIVDAAKPSFNVNGASAIKALVLTSMLSTNYICHYNAPRFYAEIKSGGIGESLRRFNKASNYGFIGAMIVSCLMMGLGFFSFGGNTMGYILNNYASNDVLATGARIAIGGALITSYPFTFFALRDGLMDIAGIQENKRQALMGPLTIGCLSVLTSLALVLRDVGFVVSIGGALFGSLLIFIVPTMMKNNFIRKEAFRNGQPLKKSEKREIFINNMMQVTGVALGAMGVGVSIAKQVGSL